MHHIHTLCCAVPHFVASLICKWDTYTKHTWSMFGVWTKHNGPLAYLTGKCHQAGAGFVDRGTKATEKTGTQQTQNPRELLPHTVPNTALEMFSGKHQHDFSKAYSKIKKIILKKAKTKKELSVFKSARQALASQNSRKPSWLLAFWKRSQHTRGHG